MTFFKFNIFKRSSDLEELRQDIASLKEENELLKKRLLDDYRAVSLRDSRIRFNKIKDWISDELPESLLLNGELLGRYSFEKESYLKGVERFDAANYKFDSSLKVKLRKEAGLAEVARRNGEFLNYAIHCFKQIELVNSQFCEVNPGRDRIANYLRNNQNIANLNSTLITVTNTAAASNLFHDTYFDLHGIQRFNSLCLVRKLNYLVYDFRNGWRQAPIIALGNKQHEDRDHKKWKIEQYQKERIFKACLLYDTFSIGNSLSTMASNIAIKPSLDAYTHMNYFRNLGSHANTDNQPLLDPRTTDQSEKARIERFWENPLNVMDVRLEAPGFYQRYIDMMFHLYSEFLKSPFF